MPSEALRVLQHIIVSHHGEPEFGAAKLPSTPEAIFVAMLDNLERTLPLRRGGEPDEVVGAALYFASDASRFTTGSVLKIDGGAAASPA